MQLAALEECLDGLPLGPLRYLEQAGSTNDEAVNWADAGAPDLALVIADEQTAGRGRHGRRWFTPPGSALAFSLVLRDNLWTGTLESSPQAFQMVLSRLTALGAIAVSQALRQSLGLESQIKWPNDILLDRRKVSGVLTEAQWLGNQPIAIIL